jgi:hypothetical protein
VPVDARNGIASCSGSSSPASPAVRPGVVAVRRWTAAVRRVPPRVRRFVSPAPRRALIMSTVRCRSLDLCGSSHVAVLREASCSLTSTSVHDHDHDHDVRLGSSKSPNWREHPTTCKRLQREDVINPSLVCHPTDASVVETWSSTRCRTSELSRRARGGVVEHEVDVWDVEALLRRHLEDLTRLELHRRRPDARPLHEDVVGAHVDVLRSAHLPREYLKARISRASCRGRPNRATPHESDSVTSIAAARYWWMSRTSIACSR